MKRGILRIKSLLLRTDRWLLFSTIAMFTLGLIMIFSASSVNGAVHGNTYGYFIKQMVNLIICLFVSVLLFQMPSKYYKKFVPIYIYIVIAGLIFVLAYGQVVNSALSWIDIGYFNIQPSEFAKSALILFMAQYYMEHKHSDQLMTLYKPLFYAALIGVLVFMQPDAGTMTIIASIVVLLFLSLPIQKDAKRYFVVAVLSLALIGTVLLLVAGKSILRETQMNRFHFTEPCDRYTDNTGYQVCNGFIAMNNGGLFGLGLGNSTQKYLYLPAAHTDFIFAVIVEELGLIWGIVILLFYLVIIYRILRIAKRSYHLMGSIIAYGVAIYITSHVIINLVGILALFPLTGVPLPFLSYGGSFALNLSIMLAMVQRVEIETKLHSEKMMLKQGR